MLTPPQIDNFASTLALADREPPMLDPFIGSLVIEATGWLFGLAWSAGVAGMTVPEVIAQRLAVELQAESNFRAWLVREGFRKPVVPGSKREPTAAERLAAEVAAWHGPRRRLACEVC